MSNLCTGNQHAFIYGGSEDALTDDYPCSCRQTTWGQHKYGNKTRQDTINEILKKLPVKKTTERTLVKYFFGGTGVVNTPSKYKDGYNQCLQEVRKLLENFLDE